MSPKRADKAKGNGQHDQQRLHVTAEGNCQQCEDPQERACWDTKANLGGEKIFEVRANYSDRMAVELFFSDEFIHDQRLYIYQEQVDPDTGDIIEVIAESRPLVLRTLLKQQLTLHGAPVIYVEDGNYNDNRELYLVHVRHPHSQYELDGIYERAALEKIFYLWGRPVHLETDEVVESEGRGNAKVGRVVDTYDGDNHTSKKL